MIDWEDCVHVTLLMNWLKLPTINWLLTCDCDNRLPKNYLQFHLEVGQCTSALLQQIVLSVVYFMLQITLQHTTHGFKFQIHVSYTAFEAMVFTLLLSQYKIWHARNLWIVQDDTIKECCFQKHPRLVFRISHTLCSHFASSHALIWNQTGKICHLGVLCYL